MSNSARGFTACFPFCYKQFARAATPLASLQLTNSRRLFLMTIILKTKVLANRNHDLKQNLFRPASLGIIVY